MNTRGEQLELHEIAKAKFSNFPPEGKISSYSSIIEQSLKLKIMKELVNLDNGKWTEEKASKHKEEMFKILNG
jgi:hypothetical protein